MAATIGSLRVDLALRTAKLQSGINKANKTLGTLEKNSKRIGGVINKAFGVIAAGGVGVLIKRSFDAVDALAKTADKIGTTTEALGGLRLAANLSGVETNVLDKAMQRLLVSVTDAEAGLSTAVDAFAALGLESKDLINLRPEDVFKRVADGIQNLGSRTEQLGVLNDIFGAKGTGLINLLDQGSSALDEAIEKVTGYGSALNRIDSKQIENANDAFTETKAAVSGIGNALAVTLAPLLENTAESLNENVAGAQGFRNEMRLMVDVAVNFVGLMQDGFRGIQIVLAAVKGGVAALREGFFTFLQEGESALVSFSNSIIGGVLKPIEAVLRALSAFSTSAQDALQSIQGFRLGVSGAFADEILNARKDIQLAKNEAEALLLGELPSDELRRRVEEAYTRAAQEAQKQVAKINESISGGRGTTSIREVTQGEETTTSTAKVEQAAKDSAEKVDVILTQVDERTQETVDTVGTLADEMARDIQNSLSDFLFDPFAEGTDGMVDQFANTLKRMAADLAASAITDQLKGIFSNIGAGAGGGEAGGGGAGAFASIASFFFADGGIMTNNGPLRLNRYASGGIARSPQLAMFGEGSGAEAFVPLPDGRSIPVSMEGGGQNITINVSTPNAESFRQSRSKLAADLRRSIQR